MEMKHCHSLWDIWRLFILEFFCQFCLPLWSFTIHTKLSVQQGHKVAYMQVSEAHFLYNSFLVPLLDTETLKLSWISIISTKETARLCLRSLLIAWDPKCINRQTSKEVVQPLTHFSSVGDQRSLLPVIQCLKTIV